MPLTCACWSAKLVSDLDLIETVVPFGLILLAPLGSLRGELLVRAGHLLESLDGALATGRELVRLAALGS